MATSDETLREFRITLPMSLEEFRIGHLYTTAEMSKDETGGGEGVEILTNEPFSNGYVQGKKELTANGKTFTEGQYTHKVHHLASKIPKVVVALAAKGSLELHEKSWNAFPYVHTELSNPDYMKDNFYLTVDSYYVADDGSTENIIGLTEQDLKERVVEKIDIVNDRVHPEDYSPEYDPSLVGSAKTGRPPIPKDGTGEWVKNVKPVMTCYKVVRVCFNWWGLKEVVEKKMLRACRQLFQKLHRRLVCSVDEFYGLTIENIRDLEEKTTQELQELRKSPDARGTIVQ